jgi:type II secretory pathway component GspD/PulD (secretin)
VNVVSRQPVTADDAVDLLNAVLIEKGYIAIRNGRILKIVNRKDAQKRDLPVQIGSDPEKIPRRDEMVTQILPVRVG